MKIYTKTGDKGETALLSGRRVSKNDFRIEAYGSVDELSSFIGILKGAIEDSFFNEKYALDFNPELADIQSILFNVGGLLACDSAALYSKLPKLTDKHIRKLETLMDDLDQLLPPLKDFIIPGGSKAAAWAHVCRTVCRRAERKVVRLTSEVDIEENIIIYLNRLSDYFFMLSRYTNFKLEIKDHLWNKKI